ncbi:MAG: bifunctional oligoribonuclease/PAP phosphatase NrnA [Termitinemataceae bacterium]|nr:MAG: bifunctional oligoribonuclease/PAP phosphatase NrnA [Termitinemataceae bacterium]
MTQKWDDAMFKATPPPAELVDFVKNHQKFLIIGHKEPDGDCIGSQLALSGTLSAMGKTAICFSEGPFKRNEILVYQNLFKTEITEADKKDAAVIIVDCSTPERTGSLGRQISGLPLALIDHHASGEAVGDVVFVDGNSPAAVLLVYALIIALGQTPNKDIASLLFLGLAADSGFFRHLDSGCADAFTIAAALINCGANPKQAYAQMNGGKSLNSRALLGTVLSKITPYYGGKLVISTEALEETERFGLESRDSDTLYQLIQSIEGVEAIAVIRQESPENCTVGLRSRDYVDVGKIASDFGGGGHKNAAGFLKPGKIADIKVQLIAAFEAYFEKPK